MSPGCIIWGPVPGEYHCEPDCHCCELCTTGPYEDRLCCGLADVILNCIWSCSSAGEPNKFNVALDVDRVDPYIPAIVAIEGQKDRVLPVEQVVLTGSQFGLITL